MLNESVTALATPDVRLRDSLVETMTDFGEVTEMHGSGLWRMGEGWPDTSETGLRALVADLRGFADPARELGDSLVHCDFFWVTDGDPEQVIGFCAVRHTLNDFLRELGGHIGYSVRPARRPGARHPRSRARAGPGRRARDRPGPGHLRLRQRTVAADDRA